MFLQVLKRNSSRRSVWGNQRLVINPRQLKQDECLIIKYDEHGNPIAIQKLGTGLSGNLGFGRAESVILPGKKGRVLYEGSSWQAYCDGARSIREGQRVLITARRSLHLFVAPMEAPLEDFF
ncbi:MAG: NfeD family protein [Cyanobacteria bacterium J06626_18]